MVPGTNMTFAGIPRGKERADVITFLNTKSDKPAELPKQAARQRRPATRPSRSKRAQRLGSCDTRRRRSQPRAADPAELMFDGGCRAGGEPSKNRHNRLNIVAYS